jgi:alpha-L-glutamate ligase-like protein/uncharacterized protein (TIGR02421 family)
MLFWRNKGILGINARNLLYIKPYNDKKAIKLADDKLKSKHFLSARGIPVPKLYGVISNRAEAAKFDFKSLPTSFVIKPNYGYGGEGIIPIVSRKGDVFSQANGNTFTEDDLRKHTYDVLDGRFSIVNMDDSAFFEQLIITDEVLGQYSFKGLPDIRIIVHNLVPVMAMLRLPTKESNGKANLHQGAIGVGIDIARGEATNCTHNGKVVHEIPDKDSIRGLKIPYWEEMLLIAAKTQLITNLGYMAIDLAIDKNVGPVLLEINARAGIGLQIANLAPLRSRLEKVKGLSVKTPERGVRLGKELFGNVQEKEITQKTGKKVIGIREEILIIRKEQNFKAYAQIDTATGRSKIDKTFAKERGLLENQNLFDEEKMQLKAKVSIDELKIQTVLDVVEFSEEKRKRGFQAVIGYRDLKNFFVDASKNSAINLLDPSTPPVFKTGKQVDRNETLQKLKQIDQVLCEIDSQIKMLHHLKPTNLQEEKEKFLKSDGKHQPQFTYSSLKFNAAKFKQQLNEINFENIEPWTKLFTDKKNEITNKINLLESRGDNAKLSEFSKKLYGEVTKEDFEKCLEFAKEHLHDKESYEAVSEEEIRKIFQQSLDKYKLSNWEIKLNQKTIGRVTISSSGKILVKEGLKISRKYLENLVTHEIETHILTAENGKKQQFGLFKSGFAKYLETQEGLALFNVYQRNESSEGELISASFRMLATYLGSNYGFQESFRKLMEIGLDENRALNMLINIKRGTGNSNLPGAFTKGITYLKGFEKVKNFTQEGGDIKDLYYGKYSLDDLSLIKSLPNLQTEKLTLPDWL